MAFSRDRAAISSDLVAQPDKSSADRNPFPLENDDGV